MKFFIKHFFSKCDQIRRFLRMWSHLLKSLMENFIFCAVLEVLLRSWLHGKFRSSHRRGVLWKKGVVENFTKFTGKHLCQRIFFNKGLRSATLFKKRLWHRCFPVNFVKFSRTCFLQNASGWLLLKRTNSVLRGISVSYYKKGLLFCAANLNFSGNRTGLFLNVSTTDSLDFLSRQPYFKNSYFDPNISNHFMYLTFIVFSKINRKKEVSVVFIIW